MYNPADLHVIAVLSNPVGYRSRLRNFRRFAEGMRNAGVTFYIVETCFPNQEFQITEAGNPRHLQLRSETELWNKEAMINRGLKLVPDSAKYVAWIDADVAFISPTWVRDTMVKLEVHPVVQLCETAVMLGPEWQALDTFRMFGAWAQKHGFKGLRTGTERNVMFNNMHSGFAWAARREVIDAVGGLLDFAVLGGGDMLMAYCMANIVSFVLMPGLPEAFISKVKAWESRIYPITQGNVGYVPGSVLHYWHGSRKKRAYEARWNMAVNHALDPDVDLRRTDDGLWEFTESGKRLQADISKYLRQRDEDSLDIGE